MNRSSPSSLSTKTHRHNNNGSLSLKPRKQSKHEILLLTTLVGVGCIMFGSVHFLFHITDKNKILHSKLLRDRFVVRRRNRSWQQQSQQQDRPMGSSTTTNADIRNLKLKLTPHPRLLRYEILINEEQTKRHHHHESPPPIVGQRQSKDNSIIRKRMVERLLEGEGNEQNTRNNHDSSEEESVVSTTKESYELPILSWIREAIQEKEAEELRISQSNECVPMKSWHTQNRPSCMKLQELDMNSPDTTTMNFINCGYSRCAFHFTNTYYSNEDNSLSNQQITETLVLKAFKYNGELKPAKLLSSQKDSMIMEHLTSSPYILNVYGYCGASQIVEHCPLGNVHDRIKEARLVDSGKRSSSYNPMGNSTNVLKMGIQIVSAVADMHYSDSTEKETMAHQDMCCHQIVLGQDGIYKLNDFHIAALFKHTQQSHDVCLHHPNGFQKLRPPEEYLARDLGEKVYSPRTDVYMCGNILYNILTHKWLFEGHTGKETRQLLIDGQRSKFPTHLLESKDPYINIMRKAIEQCWIHDPLQRPTARQVVTFMRTELAKAEGLSDESQLGVIRVELPPLPLDHRYTDEDFTNHLDG